MGPRKLTFSPTQRHQVKEARCRLLCPRTGEYVSEATEKHTLDDWHHFEVVWDMWYLNPWRSGRQMCSRLSEAGEVSALLQVCVSSLLGQDMSWLDSPVNNGILLWIG